MIDMVCEFDDLSPRSLYYANVVAMSIKKNDVYPNRENSI